MDNVKTTEYALDMFINDNRKLYLLGWFLIGGMFLCGSLAYGVFNLPPHINAEFIKEVEIKEEKK